MKRRHFLQSVYLKGIALPSAYLLAPTLSAADLAEQSDTSRDGDGEGSAHGCGRDEHGSSKQGFSRKYRDFHDPYLELVRLLKEASEIEHSLMIQYLFAAYTIKPQYQALVGPPVPSSDGLLGIAIQEMQHLAVVNKLLVALGTGPNLDRQDFPYEPDIYPFPLSLEPLTRTSLARFTYVESGRSSIPMSGPMPANDQLLYDEMTVVLGRNTGLNHVAGVYEIIIQHLEQVTDEGIVELDSWLEQLHYIMNEGELNHFRFFSDVFLGRHSAFAGRENPWRLPASHADHPSFAVPANPTAYPGHDREITEETTRTLAWLSNLHYWVVLMMLDYYYRTNAEPFNAMAQAQMIGPLQSLAKRLSERGSGLPFDRLSLGYSPAADRNGNLRLISRLSSEADALARGLGDQLPADYPLGMHAATLSIIKTAAG